MSRWKAVAILVPLIALVGYGVFWWLFPVETVRYRLTLQVETSEGLKTGSGVVETVWIYNRVEKADRGSWYVGVNGDAVVVDLGLDRRLIAILSGEKFDRGDPASLVLYILGFSNRREMTPALMGARLREAKPLSLDVTKMPSLFSFRNVEDPKKIERVDPGDLAKTFGPGVRLGTVTIEVTDDPYTVAADATLPWAQLGDARRFGISLQDIRQRIEWGELYRQPVAAALVNAAFYTIEHFYLWISVLGVLATAACIDRGWNIRTATTVISAPGFIVHSLLLLYAIITASSAETKNIIFLLGASFLYVSMVTAPNLLPFFTFIVLWSRRKRAKLEANVLAYPRRRKWYFALCMLVAASYSASHFWATVDFP